MKRTLLLSVVLLSAIVAGSAPALSAEGQPSADVAAAAVTANPQTTTPTAVIGNFYTELQNVMQDGGTLGYAGRYKRLEPVIKATFNLPFMTKFSVGTLWNNATADEQGHLVSAFSDFSVATYASRFTQYNGEKFAVLGEEATPVGTMVKTTLTPKDSAAIALNYLLKKNEAGQWRVVDVYMDGTISEMATRRAEFSSIVKRDGMGALVQSLGDKTKNMGPS